MKLGSVYQRKSNEEGPYYLVAYVSPDGNTVRALYSGDPDCFLNSRGDPFGVRTFGPESIPNYRRV